MKHKKLLTTILLLTGATSGISYLINKGIFLSAVRNNFLKSRYMYNYKWRLGEIKYIKRGTGKPLLLLHDLSSCSSSYEWNNIIGELSNHYTVYAVDLPGCGLSEKSNITYTNYLYVQAISEFVKNVIRKRTDVITSGISSDIAIMACNNDDTLFDKLLLINPNPVGRACASVTDNSKFLRLLLNTPIIGTMVYNFIFSKDQLYKLYRTSYFHNPKLIHQEYINAAHEAAHMGGSKAKFVNSSILGHYTSVNLANALRNIDNSIIIFLGQYDSYAQTTSSEFLEYNPSVESVILADSKRVPHIEQPHKTAGTIMMYL